MSTLRPDPVTILGHLWESSEAGQRCACGAFEMWREDWEIVWAGRRTLGVKLCPIPVDPAEHGPRAGEVGE